MGGLITEELTKVNDKIPLLGDIPVLGMLFRSKSEKSVKKNLLIFVTAKLVDPAGRLIRQPEADATAKPPALAPVAH
jgi:general secretion pathway protein D